MSLSKITNTEVYEMSATESISVYNAIFVPKTKNRKLYTYTKRTRQYEQ